MNPLQDHFLSHTRRHFFNRSACGLGAAALANCMSPQVFGEGTPPSGPDLTALGSLKQLHHKPTAKRVIWLFMADAPSQLDLYDYKPKLKDFYDKDLPESIRNGQRITTMTSGQTRFPCAPSIFKFAQHGQSGGWVQTSLWMSGLQSNKR